MGSVNSIMKINFESLQKIITSSNNEFLIISTLENDNQECLIKNTLSPNEEIENIKIVIYGENCSDSKVISKYNQLYKLGFTKLYVYIGGLYEWLLLQDIYGEDEFPTTTKIISWYP